MRDMAIETAPPHPHKYPKHPDAKGSIYAGACNTTRCSAGDAVWFNVATRGYYCTTCAAGINWQPGKLICTRVDRNLTHEEMDYRYAEQARKGW